MPSIKPPKKPFPNYKWRWAEVTPSEGLNEPPRFLGVLRVLYNNQGEPASSPKVLKGLAIVDKETANISGPALHLARSTDRNLLRNSGRYWKALGVLDSKSRPILLTSFGESVATGAITSNEFAIAVVKSLTLPNKFIETDVSEWESVNLQIKPLDLILQILKALYDRQGANHAYIAPFELYRIVIPLAGARASVTEHVKAIQEYRHDKLDLSAWPDCAPAANDRRIAREFLLFLANYDFCNLIKSTNNENEQYFLRSEQAVEAGEIAKLGDDTLENIVAAARKSPVIANAERSKVLAEILARPEQAAFRKDVIKKYKSTCLITGEQLSEVLQACHIIPVKYKGLDNIANSFCLRADIHILIDSKHMRIEPNGKVHYSDMIRGSVSYAHLPATVTIPKFVSEEAISWRWNYY